MCRLSLFLQEGRLKYVLLLPKSGLNHLHWGSSRGRTWRSSSLSLRRVCRMSGAALPLCNRFARTKLNLTCMIEAPSAPGLSRHKRQDCRHRVRSDCPGGRETSGTTGVIIPQITHGLQHVIQQLSPSPSPLPRPSLYRRFRSAPIWSRYVHDSCVRRQPMG